MKSPVTLFQFFHWYSCNDGQWWNYCSGQAPVIAAKGFTHVYFPPAYKSANGINEPGYAVYDLYDLGEFDQKETVRTKYGTKEEYLQCIRAFHKEGMAVIADIVLNHKHGADEKESFSAIIVNPEDRNEIVSEPLNIEGWTKFYFPGRKGKYSNFEWNHTTFTGIDCDTNGNKAIYSILNEYGDKWEDVTEEEFGNYDFLMGADIEYRNESVRQEIINWGKWYIETTGIDGFRMDAVKHISPAFIKDWVHYMRRHFTNNFFCVSEYWRNDAGKLLNYLKVVEDTTRLFDVPLHYKFHEASLKKNEYDLRTIFDGTLTQQRPDMSVTFLDNHDTQPLQALESPVDYWFKPLAYALILLREQGTPMVFYSCLYEANYTDDKDGVTHEINLAKVEELEALLFVRKERAYGEQVDYFDHANVIGWVRHGSPDNDKSGCAVVMSNADNGYKEMNMGLRHANKIFRDATGQITEEVRTDENGTGTFLVKSSSVSVWIIN